MARRSSKEWQTIIEQQEASDLTVVDFCEQQQVNRRYFYARRHILRKQKQCHQTASFVKVSKTPMNSATMSLQFRDARLTLPLDCEPLWLAQLLKAISL
jgi:putative transposase